MWNYPDILWRVQKNKWQKKRNSGTEVCTKVLCVSIEEWRGDSFWSHVLYSAVLSSKKWGAVGKVGWVVICFLNFILLSLFIHVSIFSDAHSYLL